MGVKAAACEGQRVLDSLETELKVAVSLPLQEWGPELMDSDEQHAL